MNLLIDQWIPVRPLDGSKTGKLSLRELLCGEGRWELSLPRDDMELAALQLMICITQVVLTPNDAGELRGRIAKPLAIEEYDRAIVLYNDWFQLDHPKFPFMQVRGVKAKKVISMDRLMAGLTGAENCCFVNEQKLALQLCGGCTAVALFNQASCSPSFGGGTEGGFKPGLRGSAPITTLIQGRHLRDTLWLNILHRGQLNQNIPWNNSAKYQKPAWVDSIKRGQKVYVEQISFARGLLWQPAHVELLPPVGHALCSCCGLPTDQVYRGFIREQFGFTVIGTWPHPHSPRITVTTKGMKEVMVPSFKSGVPAWTQLSRFVLRRKFVFGNSEGQQPAPVVLQAQNQQMYGVRANNLHLLVGGYLTNKASILERRHDGYILNHGWDRNTIIIDQMVQFALAYRTALYRALYVFVHGRQANSSGEGALKGALRGKDNEKNRLRIYLRTVKDSAPKDKKGRFYLSAENQFFRRAEATIENTLACLDFSNPGPDITTMGITLRQISEEIFGESVRPYRHDPELIRTVAVTRRMLANQLNSLEPIKNKGGTNATTETP